MKRKLVLVNPVNPVRTGLTVKMGGIRASMCTQSNVNYRHVAFAG